MTATTATEAAGSAHSVTAAVGLEPLAEVVPALDLLCAGVGAPVTSRPAWMIGWAAVTGELPGLWTLVAREGPHVTGAVLLVTRATHSGLLVSTVRRDADDVVVFPVCTDAAASALAEAIVQRLHAEQGPWRIELSQVASGDRVAMRLSQLLHGARVVPGAAVPRVAFERGRDLTSYLSKSTRASLRRGRARLREAGLTAEIEVVDEAAAITSLRPQLEAIHVERDHQRGRVSDLDDPATLAFWRDVIATHARTSTLQVFVLRVEGDIAAYAVVLADGAVYRVFDGRLAPRWASYAPGRQIEAAVLERALATPHVHELDWMSSVAPDALLTMTDARSTVHLICEGVIAGSI